jgi:two-component system chemotaxis sensor kinase CheA
VGESVRIEIEDDGRGIDADAVAARARAAGLPVPPGPLESPALLELICAPGFSTRAAVDRVSGRGVGMAVVRAAVRELGGTLALDTEPGRGTCFAIQLPLTLAITDALIVRVGGRSFAVPQSGVDEIVEVESSAIRQLENNELVAHRGGVLPLIRLARLFGLPESPRDVCHALVVGRGSAAVAFAVERVAGQREIVVRPFGDALLAVDGITGATELGDGRAVLIVDVVALARRAAQGVLLGGAPTRRARPDREPVAAGGRPRV